MTEEIKEETKSTEAPKASSASAPSSAAPSTSSSGGGSKTAATVIIIVVVAVIVLGVGGWLVSRYVARKLGEKTAETLIGAATGGKVDVDSNGDSINLKSGDSDMSIGSSSTWPDTMPSDVPKFSYGKINYSTADKTNKTWSVGFETVATDAYSKYTSALKSAGWTVTNETDLGAIKTGSFEKGTWTINLTVDPESKGATLGVSEKF